MANLLLLRDLPADEVSGPETWFVESKPSVAVVVMDVSDGEGLREGI